MVNRKLSNREKGMCQTALIADNIARLSMRSYRHRQEVATPDAYRASQLVRLNRALGSLCELLYDQWQTVTEDDYRRFEIGRASCRERV